MLDAAGLSARIFSKRFSLMKGKINSIDPRLTFCPPTGRKLITLSAVCQGTEWC